MNDSKLGTNDRKMTGYASIDKPWLKYYTDEQINEKALDISVYENMYLNNKDN